MSINDTESPKIAAIKLLHDELYPHLILTNQITLNMDNQIHQIHIYCVNPHREIGILITNNGKIKISYRAMNGPIKETEYDIADPRSAPRTLNYILKNDKELFQEYIKGITHLTNKYDDIIIQLQPLLGE